jgi:hypothetical protein
MDHQTFDLKSARSLFLRAQKISLGFLNKEKMKTAFVNLHFSPDDDKLVHSMLQQLFDALKGEKLKLFIYENGGEQLYLTFLWESRAVIFSSLPEHFSIEESKQFMENASYGNDVKMFFLITGADDMDRGVVLYKGDTPILNLEAVYYMHIL